MKTLLLFAGILLSSSIVQSQTLKEALYSGKLKTDTGKTIASKDTSKLKTLILSEPVKPAAPVVSTNSTPEKSVTESSVTPVPGVNETVTVDGVKTDDVMPDSLNKLYHSKQKVWKRFIDGQMNILTIQADENRKIRKGEYHIEIEYEIGLNGRITTKNVTSVPQNDFLIEQTKQFMSRTPVLAPPVFADGKPRVAAMTQQLTILKK